jgi:hypothetical protein
VEVVGNNGDGCCDDVLVLFGDVSPSVGNLKESWNKGYSKNMTVEGKTYQCDEEDGYVDAYHKQPSFAWRGIFVFWLAFCWTIFIGRG